MKALTSFSTVIALWLTVSFCLWLAYRQVQGRGGRRRQELGEAALKALREGRVLILQLRQLGGGMTPEALLAVDEEAVRERVRELLNAIDANSAYFNRVHVLAKSIQKTFRLEDFPPLEEILQVRRDFWAASEVLLIEDVQSLGLELISDEARVSFRHEALGLLFGEGHSAGAEPADPLLLRFSLAETEILRFQEEIEADIAAKKERHRMPTPAEIIAGPWQLARSVAFGVRQARRMLAELGGSARNVAVTLASKSVRAAAEELRRQKSELPQKFAGAFERAGGAAVKGGATLKRHYEFLLEAQELRARYAEFLAKAPALSEKGRQFLARLELEARAEEFREASEGALAFLRLKIVLGIAYLIRGLQILQARLTPAANKQLAPLAAAAAGATAQTASAPFAGAQSLRVRLPAPKKEDEEVRLPRFVEELKEGAVGPDDAEKDLGEPSPKAPMGPSGSLLERLAAIEAAFTDDKAPTAAAAGEGTATSEGAPAEKGAKSGSRLLRWRKRQ